MLNSERKFIVHNDLYFYKIICVVDKCVLDNIFAALMGIVLVHFLTEFSQHYS